MAATSFLGLLLTIALGAIGLPLPVGLPPLPEDPALMRAAPANTLAYVQWSGFAKPDPTSGNRTEQLVAEPELRTLVDRLIKATRGAMRQELRGREYAQAERTMRFLLEVVQRPGCLFVDRIDLKTGKVSGGIVVNLGDRKQQILAAFRSLTKVFLGREPVKDDASGQEKIPLPPGLPAAALQVHGDHLVLGIGDGAVNEIATRLDGDGEGLRAHPTFAKHAKAVAVERTSTRLFVDTAGIFEVVGPLPPEAANGLSALGIDGVTALLSETGLEGNGFVSRAMLATPKRGGILSLFDGAPLTQADAAIVPADATFATLVRLDPAKAWGTFLDVLGKFEPRARDEMEREIADDFERNTGVRLVEDLLEHCGDAVAIWNSPRQGGLVFPGIVLSVSLDDAEKFRAGFGKFMEAVKRELAPRRSSNGRLRRGVFVQETKLANTTAWWLNTVGDDVPFAPAWCVTETHLLFSLFPQALKAAIRHTANDGSLAKTVQGLLTPEARAIGFVDMPRLFDLAYPVLQMLAQLACAELQREGFRIDITALPGPATFRKHLRSEVTRLETRAGGIRLERKGTLPLADPLVGSLLPGIGGIMTFGYMSRARVMHRAAAEAARREAVRRAAERRRDKK